MEERKDRLKKLREKINKKAGYSLAYNLNEVNPTEVTDWIPTGSRWLDSIICSGKMAGIPLGKIIELAGTSGVGKSYLALQVAFSALKKGIDVIYFDSESAIDKNFIVKMGFDLNDLMYVQAESIEFVFETIQDMLSANEKPMLFVLDSVANCPTRKEFESSFDPRALMAQKALVLSKVFQKLTIPLANHGSTLLLVNQLKTNISQNAKYDPWFTPGGKSPEYLCSLRIWLTVSNSKDNIIKDEYDDPIGSLVRVKIKKSRFGSFGKTCEFKILWGGDGALSVQDEESWYEAIKPSDRVVDGPWCKFKMSSGEEVKFRKKDWKERLKDPDFRQEVIKIMDELYIEGKIEKKSDNNQENEIESGDCSTINDEE